MDAQRAMVVASCLVVSTLGLEDAPAEGQQVRRKHVVALPERESSLDLSTRPLGVPELQQQLREALVSILAHDAGVVSSHAVGDVAREEPLERFDGLGSIPRLRRLAIGAHIGDPRSRAVVAPAQEQARERESEEGAVHRPSYLAQSAP